MIALKINGEFLDVPEDITLGMEDSSSLFRTDTVPGLFTYPVTLPATAKNERLLNFPGLLNTSGVSSFKDIPCSCFLQGILWQSGKLNILKVNSKGILVNFRSGSADISGKEISLQEIDLGTDVLSYQTASVYPDANYILFPVKNPDFYGEASAAYKGYLNYYDGSFLVNVSANFNTIVPFPFLSFIFRKVMAHFGYTVKTGWLDSPEISKVVIYNNYALDKVEAGINVFQTAIDFSNHVPDMKAADFLNAIRSRYFLDYHFDTKAKTLEIIPLREIIADQAYIDQTEILDPDYDTDPNNTDGFILKMELDGADSLTPKEVATWNLLKVGNGAEPITTLVSTLEIFRGEDANNPARNWLVPHAAQKGSSPEFGVGLNKFSLRLLTYLGMQPDSQGNLYPLGSADVVNYNGTSVGTEGHRWDGASGVYQNYAKPWLDFRSTTRKIERSVQMDIVDLFNLEHKKKWLSTGPEGTVKMLYEKLSYSISGNGIKPTKGIFYKTNI